MALAVNQLPVTMVLSWMTALFSTTEVMTAGTTNATPPNPLK
jgi:hypothetical protein